MAPTCFAEETNSVEQRRIAMELRSPKWQRRRKATQGTAVEKTCSDVEVNTYDLLGVGKVQKSEEKESGGDANLRRGTERRRRRNVRPW